MFPGVKTTSVGGRCSLIAHSAECCSYFGTKATACPFLAPVVCLRTRPGYPRGRWARAS